MLGTSCFPVRIGLCYNACSRSLTSAKFTFLTHTRFPPPQLATFSSSPHARCGGGLLGSPGRRAVECLTFVSTAAIHNDLAVDHFVHLNGLLWGFEVDSLRRSVFL